MGIGQYFLSLWQAIRTGILGTVSSIGVADVLDMLIVAFVLYKFMQFLRRSRLGLVAKSILIIVSVVWLSGRFHLTVVHFATSRAVEMGILALIILFQQEIRQSLERLGRNDITRIFGKEEKDLGMGDIIFQTVSACVTLSRKKTGALIVFEREVTLEEEIRTGTALDARVSAELLGNIFYDKAPLHDGAVIVSGKRILSAGCVLPLTDSVNLSRDLGMRHRAAIGISEKSDAVAVVVSEETGAISLAINGKLRRNLSAELFEQTLREELETVETAKTFAFLDVFRGKKA